MSFGVTAIVLTWILMSEGFLVKHMSLFQIEVPAGKHFCPQAKFTLGLLFPCLCESDGSATGGFESREVFVLS